MHAQINATKADQHAPHNGSYQCKFVWILQRHHNSPIKMTVKTAQNKYTHSDYLASKAMAWFLENGWLSDRYRIGTDTGCIVSNRISYCCIGRYYVHHCRFINCGRIALHTMIKGRSSDPSPARRAGTRACCLVVHDTGEGRRRKETITWYRHPPDTKTTQYWSWPPSRRTPSTSRKW